MADPTDRWADLDAPYPVRVNVDPAYSRRDRLTTAFRLILAIPHLILVGGPGAVFFWWMWGSGEHRYDWGAGGGVLGAVAGVVTLIAWFAILITGRYPEGMWRFSVGTLRWQARVNSYLYFLRDEYPPFNFDDPYPAQLELAYPTSLSRLLIFIKWLLIIPHTFVLYFVQIAAGVVWFIAFFAILITGRYPEGMFRFMVGVLRWSNRVSAYSLLLTDDYPPFTLDSESGYAAGSTTPSVSYQ